jgi:acetoacetate decarboxylase
MFPNSHYQFDKRDTVAYAAFTVESLRNLTWLSGGGYDLAALYVHGVLHKSSDGQVRKGSFCPVMLENLADPIITGREELGIPKLFSDIKINRDETSYRAEISWRGAQWAVVELEHLQPSTDGTEPNNSDEGLFVHKYIPSADVDKPDADYDAFHPTDRVSAVHSTLVTDSSTAKLKFHDLGPRALPTLHPIAARLAELPVLEIVRATVTEYDGILDWSKQERLR